MENKPPNKPFIVSEKQEYDEDKQQYGTYLGRRGKNMPLYCTVWADTPELSRERATRIGEILTAHLN